jgi:hypothetical protein
MEPSISDAAEVVIEHASFASIMPGEVVAFSFGNEMYVHRVMARTRSTLITAGDNMSLFDPPVRQTDYIGRVVEITATADKGQLAPFPIRRTVGASIASNVHFWLITSKQREIAMLEKLTTEWEIESHVLQRTGIGVSQDTLSVLREGMPTSALRIGVSSAAVAPIESLPHLLENRCNRQLHFVIGCSFGSITAGQSRLIPPHLVEWHMRTGAPHVSQSTFNAAACVVGALMELSADLKRTDLVAQMATRDLSFGVPP